MRRFSPEKATLAAEGSEKLAEIGCCLSGLEWSKLKDAIGGAGSLEMLVGAIAGGPRRSKHSDATGA